MTKNFMDRVSKGEKNKLFVNSLEILREAPITYPSNIFVLGV